VIHNADTVVYWFKCQECGDTFNSLQANEPDLDPCDVCGGQVAPLIDGPGGGE
jgi:predicted nucleic acid-binding Zn ribbon protein